MIHRFTRILRQFKTNEDNIFNEQVINEVKKTRFRLKNGRKDIFLITVAIYLPEGFYYIKSYQPHFRQS